MTPEELEDLKGAVSLGGVVYHPHPQMYFEVRSVDDTGQALFRNGESVDVRAMDISEFCQVEPIFRP